MNGQRVAEEVELDWQDRGLILLHEALKVFGQGALFALGSHTVAKIVQREKPIRLSRNSNVHNLKKVN